MSPLARLHGVQRQDRKPEPLAHEIDERPITGDLCRRDRRPIEETLIGRQFAKRDSRGSAAAWREQRNRAGAKRREPAQEIPPRGRDIVHGPVV